MADPTDDPPSLPPQSLRRQRLHSPPEIKQSTNKQCAYCEAPLSGHVFFCLVCGKPYREAPGSNAMPPPKSRGEIIQETVPDFWPVLWSYALVLFASLIISYIAFDLERGDLVFGIILSSALLFSLTVFLAIKYSAVLRPSIHCSGLLKWESWAGLCLLIPLLAINWVWHGPVLEALGGEDFEMDMSMLGLSLPMQLVLISLLPAFSEEVGFRGLLQPMLTQALGRKKAILYISFLFAAMHLSVYSFPYLLLLGYLLGWMRGKSGSIYPGIIAHAAHNAFVVLFFWT